MYRQASVIAVVATICAVGMIFILLFVEKDHFEPPEHKNPSFSSFFLGFGSILFGFGGASIFPTIQNDMKERSQFWKSVIVAFASML